MGQAGQRVRLVHELAELAGAEELLDGRHDRTDVDERLGCDGLDVLGRHALAHDALHARQADAHLVLDQLAHRTHTAVAEVVDVVAEVVVGLVVGVQLHEVRDRREDVGLRQLVVDRAGTRIRVRDRELVLAERELLVLVGELLRNLVTTDLGHVVALGVEEEVLDELTRGVGRRRLARTQLAVDVDERLFCARGVVLRERVAHRVVGLTVVVEDEREQLLLGLAEAERLEEDRDRLLALAVDADVDDVLLVDLELEPRAAARDHLGVDDVLLGLRLVGADVEVDARRPHELRHDDALGAVDDERAARRHHGEVAHEDGLLLDLTRRRVHEPRRHEERTRVGHVLVATLLLAVLRRVEDVIRELELEGAGEVLDRRDVGEDLGDAHLDEVVERQALDGDEIRELQDLGELGEGQTFAGRETRH